MMKMPGFIFKMGLILTLLSLGANGWAYQEIEVKKGGTIQGKAILTGSTPFPRVYHLVLFPNIDMCAEVDSDENMNRVLDDFKTSSKGELKDVVVILEHVDAGKPFNKDPVVIDAENCKFMPAVNVIRQGEEIKINNIDAVMHNSQVYQSERGKIILNIPIPAEEVSDGKIHFQKNYKIYQMICGMHEFMQTWGYRVQNPYYAITNKTGDFKIENIPPGDYVVNAWHYLIKLRSQKVHVTENSVINLKFEFDGDEVIRPFYETNRSGRIKHGAATYKEKVYGKE